MSLTDLKELFENDIIQPSLNYTSYEYSDRTQSSFGLCNGRQMQPMKGLSLLLILTK